MQLILGYRGLKEMHKTIGTPQCTLRQPWVSVAIPKQNTVGLGEKFLKTALFDG